jgi:hypothetical protein
VQNVKEYQKIKKGPREEDKEEEDEGEDGEWCGMKRARDDDEGEDGNESKTGTPKDGGKELSRAKKVIHKPKTAAAKKSKLAPTKKKGGGKKKK